MGAQQVGTVPGFQDHDLNVLVASVVPLDGEARPQGLPPLLVLLLTQ